MATQVKYRKCPKCGSKMLLRKSSKNNSKFWGCSAWRETNCDGLVPYFGDGARAGFDVDVREIENGYIITTSPKYAEQIEDDTAKERHCGAVEELEKVLTSIVKEKVSEAVKQIVDSTEFVDEIDEEKHKERVQVVQRGTNDPKELLKRIAKLKQTEGPN